VHGFAIAAVLRSDASRSAMHHTPARKPPTPYSFFDVAECLQTRMQNARDEQGAKRDAKSPYSTRLFHHTRGEPAQEKGPGFWVVPLCPKCCVTGIEEAPQNRPPLHTPSPRTSNRKKPLKSGLFQLSRFPLRAVQTLQRRLQNSRRVGNAIWRKSFSRQPAMHGHERCIEVHSVQGRPC
jgi:hypothetical protein